MKSFYSLMLLLAAFIVLMLLAAFSVNIEITFVLTLEAIPICP